MIEEDDDTGSKPHRIGQFQDTIPVSRLSHHHLIYFGENIIDPDIIVKGHDREGRPEEADHRHKDQFDHLHRPFMLIHINVFQENIRLTDALHTGTGTDPFDLLDHLQQADHLSFRLPFLKVMQFDRFHLGQHMFITAGQTADILHIHIFRL